MNSALLSKRRQLLLLLTLVLTVGFLTISLVSYQTSRTAIHDSIVTSQLPLTSDNIYSEIQKDLIRPILISALMASDTFVRDWVLRGEKDIEEMRRYLNEIMVRHGAFTSFSFRKQHEITITRPAFSSRSRKMKRATNGFSAYGNWPSRTRSTWTLISPITMR